MVNTYMNGRYINFIATIKKQYEDPTKVKNRNYHVNPESHIWVYIQMKTIF